jgi:putative flippase GtrA
MSTLIRQLFWFVVVGCSSALVHWLVVVALVSHWSIAPLLANVAGWLVAFLVSFTGHYQLTFRHHDTQAREALQRFFALSASGFLINELSYAALLRWTHFDYQWLLAAVLVGVAFMTFVISKFWAFAPQRRTQ